MTSLHLTIVQIAALFPIIVAIIVIATYKLLNTGRNTVEIKPIVFTQVNSQNTPVWVAKHVSENNYQHRYISVEQAARERVANERMNSYLYR